MNSYNGISTQNTHPLLYGYVVFQTPPLFTSKATVTDTAVLVGAL